MKYIIVILLIVTSACKNTEQEKQSKYEKSQNTYFSVLWLLIARDKNEDPDCGGDALGTLFGLNNNRTRNDKLEENQDLTSDEFNVYYQSSNKTFITVTLTQVTTNKVGADCSQPGSIVFSYCNGVYRALSYRDDRFQLNQAYQFEALKNIKNFVSIGSNTTDCSVQFNLKSEVQ